MKNLQRCYSLGLLIAVLWLLAGCAGQPATEPAVTSPVSPPAAGRITIYAPASPSSIPVILAAKRMPNADITIFTNHSQANTLFLRGDISILVTGLSVGVEFFKNKAPAQVVNTYVSDLTYLVTYGQKITSLSQLKGKEIYMPFEGSPIEEMTQFLAAQEGLVWKQDIKPVYSPFPASVELLKQGKATAVALPEPFVSLVEKQDQVFVSMSYRAKWDAITGSTNGYPQVASFVNPEWAAAHPQEIARFNELLAQAIAEVQQNPEAAAQQTSTELKFPPAVLQASLQRTGFAMLTGTDMATAIQHYYQTIGKPLDDKFAPFFYRLP